MFLSSAIRLALIGLCFQHVAGLLLHTSVRQGLQSYAVVVPAHKSYVLETNPRPQHCALFQDVPWSVSHKMFPRGTRKPFLLSRYSSARRLSADDGDIEIEPGKNAAFPPGTND